MSGRGKKAAGKATKAKNVGSAKMMGSWLTRSKVSASEQELASIQMEEGAKAPDSVAAAPVVAKKAGRSSRLKPSPEKPKESEKPAVEPPAASDEAMEGIESTSIDDWYGEFEKKVEIMHAKTAKDVSSAKAVGSRTRGRAYRNIAPVDVETAAVMSSYGMMNLDEEDSLLHDVLGTSKSTTTSSFPESRAKNTTTHAVAPRKKVAKLEIFHETADGKTEILPEQSTVSGSKTSSDPTNSSSTPDNALEEPNADDSSNTAAYSAPVPKKYSTWASARRLQTDPMDALLLHSQYADQYDERLSSVLQEERKVASPNASQGNQMEVDVVPKVAARAKSIDELDDGGPTDHGDTSFYLPFFSPAMVHPVPSHYCASSPSLQVFSHLLSEEEQMLAPAASADSNSMAVDADVPAHVKTLNNFITRPNSVTKLPLLKKYLKRIPHECPKHIVYWLLSILCFVKHDETAYEAYDVLLSLIPPPVEGHWPARIAKCGSLSISPPVSVASSKKATKSAPKENLMTPLTWDYPLLSTVFEKVFGAGSSTKSYLSILKESAELKKSAEMANGKAKKQKAKLARLLRKGVEQDNLMDRLERHAESKWMSDGVTAAGLALEEAQKVHLMKHENFRSTNFSLFSLLLAASLHSASDNCIPLALEEKLIVTNGIYSALVDASCQNSVLDLQILLRALLISLFGTTPAKDFSVILHHLCASLWLHLAPPTEAELNTASSHTSSIVGRARFHTTLFRWSYLTPCSASILKHVRSGMAWYFLRALDASYTRFNNTESSNTVVKPIITDEKIQSASNAGHDIDPFPTLESLLPTAENGKPRSPSAKKPYQTAHIAVDLTMVSTWLSSSRLPKTAKPAEWAMYADFVLLIEMASACFAPSELPTLRRFLTQWDTGFQAWQKLAKERSNLNLHMARFKDVSTLATTKFTILKNSVQRPNPMASFISPKKAAAAVFDEAEAEESQPSS